MHDNPFLVVDQQITGDIYTSREIWENLATLCDDYGARFGGSDGEAQAAQFIKGKLEAYGLQNVHLDDIPYAGWRRGRTSFKITAPVQRSLAAISLPHSPPAAMTGVLIDMGDGAPEDFDERAEEIAGKIVLVTSEVRPKGGKRWVHRNEKYGRALLAGAVGFIFVNHYPGFGVVTGGIGEEGYPGLIPAVGLSHEDGTYLQRLIARHDAVTIQLDTTDEIEPMVSWNIVGDLPGRSDTDTVVMLGCHYDGHDISQGAGDPASGAVSVIEAARVLAKYAADLPVTIRFALWGVEEIGLLGSTQYVTQKDAELDNVRFYLNLDSAGVIDPKDIELNMWAELEPVFTDWSRQMALDFNVGQSVNAFSDHFPFLKAGVPTGGVGSLAGRKTGRGYGHTRHDTLDKIELRSLREAATLAARLALRIASADSWPASRRSAAAVHEVLDSPENQEATEIFDKILAYYEAHQPG